MAEKVTALSIQIRTVDKATAGLKAINARLDAITKPTRDFKKALGGLYEKSGLEGVVSGFKGVGSAIEGLLSKVAIVGGVAGAATAGLIHLVNEFDDLGKKAARLGVGADFLAEMRFAAEKTGVPLEALDSGLETFNQNLGQARANTGRMAKFVGAVSPVLLQQLKAAKGNAEAFDLLAGAMAKITDPAKRAALAQKTLGDSALAPLFARGAKGIKELRDRYLELAGSQEGAVGEAEKTGDAMHDLHAATDGVKAALVKGLSPALTTIIGQLTKWLTSHRGDVERWAKDLGDRLPGAIKDLVEWGKKAVAWAEDFIDKIGGLKNIAIAAAAVLSGPLIVAFAELGAAIASSPLALSLIAIGALIDKIQDFTRKPVKPYSSSEQLMAPLHIKFPSIPIFPRPDAQTSALLAALPGPINRPDLGSEAHALSRGVSMSDQARALLAPASMLQQEPQRAQIEINVNGPRGTRVRTDPSSTADVDLNVGYQLGLAP